MKTLRHCQRLSFRQHLPVSVEQAWQYFSNPANLPRITPPWLDFRVLSPLREAIYPGMMVAYDLRPMLGLRRFWLTEITHMAAPRYFVDEQRVGPYRFWQHQHHFCDAEGGVLVEDLVHYVLPLSLLSPLGLDRYVRGRLEAIFAYRREALEEVFGRRRA